MKKFIIVIFLIILFFSLRDRSDRGDFSKMNEVLVSKLCESPEVCEVFGIYTESAVET